ncbi:hypothetical protein [Streptacidiphilus sp. P02-A3a]|uniref:hypothetical protein n=1 Tax=Streptacidiphilus sp. P02-A3a TaxID=2704468 RepID=UPI0015F9A39F|nr:hypothetical protein [Streptacidiphilus sp. P02-A3a]QMU72550.1 hypothetical protein GXP74_34190 [Streptacidiphilus sp. P02-A3a]
MAEVTGRPGVVPYITAWSAERSVRPEVVGLPGVGLAYRDELPYDRDSNGNLWTRMAFQCGCGRPEFGRVHPGRQRRAMRGLLCQVCGGPADRTAAGVLWLLKDDRGDWPGWPEGLAATHPPACVPCARAADRLCPHLRGGSVAVRVRDFRVRGVYGALYQGAGPSLRSTGSAIAAADDRLARWILAAQMVRVLSDCSFATLDW